MTVNALKSTVITKNEMMKTKLIVFIDIKCVILEKRVPEGTLVNQYIYIYIYKGVLTKLRRRVRRKILEMWINSFILYQDNAPVHTVLPVKQFLANKHILHIYQIWHHVNLIFLNVLQGICFESIAVKIKQQMC